MLIANRTSGTGHSGADATRLAAALERGGVGAPVRVEVVADHASARAAARAFLSCGGCRAVVAAGGGGTLRAVVEAACDGRARPPAASEVRVAALRMGSGNVVPKQYGVPADPIAAAELIGRALAAEDVRPLSVLRCRHGTASGDQEVRHAVAMCGLGEWGRVPGDIERWRRSAAGARRVAAGAIGLERVNHLEYVATAVRRFGAAAVAPGRLDRVAVSHPDGGWQGRLLAGAVLNFPIPLLPDPELEAGEPRAAAFLLRHGSLQLERVEIAPDRALRLELLEPRSTEFFLDEDPERAWEWIELDVAGTLAFTPVAA